MIGDEGMENPSMDEIKNILATSKTIAVVGLSDKPDRTSYQVTEAMIAAGYDIIPINPKADEIFGKKALNSLSELTEPVDIINVFRKNDALPMIAEEAAKIDAKVFWCQQGLDSEEAYKIAKDVGMTVIMDFCIKVAHSLTK